MEGLSVGTNPRAFSPTISWSVPGGNRPGFFSSSPGGHFPLGLHAPVDWYAVGPRDGHRSDEPSTGVLCLAAERALSVFQAQRRGGPAVGVYTRLALPSLQRLRWSKFVSISLSNPAVWTSSNSMKPTSIRCAGWDRVSVMPSFAGRTPLAGIVPGAAKVEEPTDLSRERRDLGVKG